MRLALASDRHRGSLQPRNGNRIWLVTCIVTVLVAVVVVLKVTGSSCPADPRADGVAAVGGASPGTSHPGAGRAGAGGTGAGGSAAGGAGTGGVGASALATSPALARSMIEGHAVFYDPGQAAGSCGLGPFPAGGRYASLPPRSFASGRACGSYLDVYGPRGTVRAEVVDVCTDCAAGSVRPEPGGLRPDRRPQGRPGRGELPDRPGPAAARAAGAPDLRRGAAWHPGRAGHQPRQPAVVGRGQLAGGRWQRLAPSADGYWTGPLRPGRPRPGAPAGRAAGTRIRIRVTDVAGHQVVLTGVSGRSTVLHATTWMYRGRGLAGSQSGLSPALAARAGRHAGPAGPTASC